MIAPALFKLSTSSQLGLLDGVEDHLDLTAERQSRHSHDSSPRPDPADPKHDLPPVVQEPVVAHVAGQVDRGAIDVIRSQTASREQIDHLLQHLDCLILGIAIRLLLLGDSHHTGEVEVIADLHNRGVRLTRNFELTDFRRFLFLGHYALLPGMN